MCLMVLCFPSDLVVQNPHYTQGSHCKPFWLEPNSLFVSSHTCVTQVLFMDFLFVKSVYNLYTLLYTHLWYEFYPMHIQQYAQSRHYIYQSTDSLLKWMQVQLFIQKSIHLLTPVFGDMIVFHISRDVWIEHYLFYSDINPISKTFSEILIPG